MNWIGPFTLCALANLAGCQRGHAAIPTTAPATATSPSPLPTPISQRATTPASNAYVHPGTKMAFLEKVTGFDRVAITKYAPDESDISAGYNSSDPANPIAATVFVFPAPAVSTAPTETPDAASARQFRRALDAAKKEIANAHADAKLISEADFTLTEGGRSHKGTRVSYELAYNFGAGQVSACSEIFLFSMGTGRSNIEFPTLRLPPISPCPPSTNF